MKKYIIIMFLLVATSYTTYGMDYLNNVWNNVRQKYIEWRNPELIKKLQETTVEERRKKLPLVIKEYYEQDKPLYINILSAITPLESEKTVVRRAYNQLNKNFNNTFYTDKANPTQLFIDLNKLPNKLVQDFESIRSLILYGKNNEVNKTDFENLKNKINLFIEDLKKINEVSEIDKTRLTFFQKFLDKLSSILQQPHMSQIERWHRNRVADRIKEYFNLQ